MREEQTEIGPRIRSDDEPNEPMIAFWLVPRFEEKELFGALIKNLAARFEAPVFEPHVTLFGDRIEKDGALQTLQGIAEDTAPLQLKVERIGVAGVYTKTLFVQFRPSVEAGALAARIRAALHGESSYRFDPHLSLLYKDMPLPAKAQLASEIEIPLPRVTFDLLKVIRCPAQIHQREDVEAWQTIGERPLAGR